MRNVTGVIKTLMDTPYADKEIRFVLCDRYGNEKNRLDRTDTGDMPGTCPRGDIFDTQIETDATVTTDATGAFSVWLNETACDDLGDYYRMECDKESGIMHVKLYVRRGDGPIDWEKLTVPYVGDVALSELLCDKKINPNAKRVLERFFNGEKLHNANEQRLIQNYLNYADGYNDKKAMQHIDEGVMDG